MADVDSIQQPVHTPVKHSGPGIASFILSIAVGVYEFYLFGIAGVLDAKSPGGMDPESAVAIILGLLIIGGLIVGLAGAGLGFGGLFQKNRHRVFSVLGLVFNMAIFVGVIVLITIGIRMP